MLYFHPWKLVLILGACLLGVLYSLPNLFSPATLASFPSWAPHSQVNLGLDLRGGAHFLLEVDMNAVLRERLNATVDAARTELRNAKINYSGGITVRNNQVEFTVIDLARLDDVRALVRKIDPDLQATIGSDGHVALAFNEVEIEKRRSQILDQSIETVRRRIDELGTKEPTIQREGSDRILLQLPGVGDTTQVKKVLTQLAKMTFQLVDESAMSGEVRPGMRVPIGDELLPSAPDPRNPNAPVQYYMVQRRVMVAGDDLVDAQGTFDQNSRPIVSFKFNATGGRKFGDVTKSNVGKRFAIVLDGKVISAPVIQSAIIGGSGIIEGGGFTAESTRDLALLLRAGALPAPLTILEERTVGPDLGADSIHAGTTASLVGVGLVVVFMLIFYGLFGLFANVALFFNLCMMMAALSLLGATLTLPGIAGIALTMGMAVDANVLIYERIREEVRSGRTMLSALEAGFARAFGTILDSHVTTFVAGVLMFWLGSGPVKGFAVTLCLGVATSLFSAILVTRLQIVTWVRRFRPKAIPI